MGGMAGPCSSHNTQYLSTKFADSCQHGSWHPKAKTIVTEKITDGKSP